MKAWNRALGNSPDVLCFVQSLSCVRVFVTQWTVAHQVSLSFTTSRSLLILMSSESVMPSNHLVHYHTLLLLPSIFPSIRVFSNVSAVRIRWPMNVGELVSLATSASASGLPMSIQDWFPLGLTGLISLQSKELSRVFSNTTIQQGQNILDFMTDAIRWVR